MKSFDSPILAGGSPIFNEDLVDILQENSLGIWRKTLEALRLGCPEGVIISGVVVSDGGGGTFDTTEGIVFLDDDFYTLPAQTGIANPSYILKDTDTNISRVFRDLATKNIITERKAKVQGSIPASDQYITLNRIALHHGWVKWTDHFAIKAGWAEDPNYPIQFKKNLDGTVSFRGALVYDTGSVVNDEFLQDLDTGDLAPGVKAIGGSPTDSKASSVAVPQTGTTPVKGLLFNGNATSGITASVIDASEAGIFTYAIEITYGTQLY